jgi:hypothetical protein
MEQSGIHQIFSDGAFRFTSDGAFRFTSGWCIPLHFMHPTGFLTNQMGLLNGSMRYLWDCRFLERSLWKRWGFSPKPFLINFLVLTVAQNGRQSIVNLF